MPLYPTTVLERLRNRVPKTIDEGLRLVRDFECTYGRFGFESSHKNDRQHDGYYLKSIDAVGIRTYELHSRQDTIRVNKRAESLVTWIEFLQETIDHECEAQLMAAIEPGRIHIFTSACKNFCIGASASGTIDVNTFLSGASKFAGLLSLLESCSMPIITLCHGATRGGGMLFPSIADVVVATNDASFAFPEVRRGVLPGVVSVPSKRRMSARECRRWMMTGASFDSTMGKSSGFVDAICNGTIHDAKLWIDQVVTSLLAVPVQVLESRKRIVNACGNLEVAVLESGTLSACLWAEFLIATPEAINLSLLNSSVAILELTDSNNLSLRMLHSLSQRVDELKASSSLKLVVVRGVGDDFCFGGEPSKWLQEIKGECIKIDEAASILHRGVSLCTELWGSLSVPVVAIVHGTVAAGGLALALTADLRVAVADTKFEFGSEEDDYLLAISTTVRRIVGAANSQKLCRSSGFNGALDATAALAIKLVRVVSESKPDALQLVINMFKDVCTAQADGLHRTIKLLRGFESSEASIGRCVAYSRTLFRSKKVDSVSKSLDLLDVEMQGSSLIVQYRPTDSLLSLMDTLIKYNMAEPERKIIIIQSGNWTNSGEVLLLSESLLQLIDWFCMDHKRPLVMCVCNCSNASLLLPLLCDKTLCAVDSSFDSLSVRQPVLHSLLVRRHGVTSSARLAYLMPCDTLSASDAEALGLVSCVQDLSHNFEKVDLFARYLPHRMFPASYSVTVVEAVLRNMRDSNVLPLVELNEIRYTENGVAVISLTAAAQMIDCLNAVKRRISCVRGVVIDATRTLESPDLVQETFQDRVRLYAETLHVVRLLRSLSIPICALVNGSISALSSVVMISSDVRVGTSSAHLDFGDDLTAGFLFDLTEALPGLVGPTAAETLRFDSRCLSAVDAVDLGLLTDIVDGSAEDNMNALADMLVQMDGCGKFRDQDWKYHLSEEAMAERCISMALRANFSEPRVIQSPPVDHTAFHRDGMVVNITLNSILANVAASVVESLRHEDILLVVHSDGVADMNESNFDLDSYISMIQALRSNSLPVIVVCRNEWPESLVSSLILFAADIIVADAKLSDERRLYFADWKPSEIVTTTDVDAFIKDLISRFRQVGTKLLRSVKANFPATCKEYAVVTMNLTLKDRDDTQIDLSLVKLNVSDGVAVVELADTVHFNSMGAALMLALYSRIRQVHHLAVQGEVKCMLLQGLGPHFCVGGWDLAYGHESSPTALTLFELACQSEVGKLIRSLPIPTLAAVHGKLLGGGLALALAADWRICAAGTTFNFGNLPRNKSPLFMLSRSLPLSVGLGTAMAMYLEDSVVVAEEAMATGLVNDIAATAVDAKQKAFHLAKSFRARSNAFFHGPIPRLCTSDTLQFSQEILLFSSSLPNIQQVSASKLKPVSVNKPLKRTEKNQVTVSRDKIMSTVIAEVRNLLAAAPSEELDHLMPLMEAGLDSLASTQLVKQLESGLDLKLSSTLMFTYPTIDSLTEYLFNQLNDSSDDIVENALVVDSIKLLKGVNDSSLTNVLLCQSPVVISRVPSKLELMPADAVEMDLQRAAMTVAQGDGESTDVVFLFTGQGSQYEDMGKVLYETESTFRLAMDRCEAAFRNETGESLLSIVFPNPSVLRYGSHGIAKNPKEHEQLLHQTQYAQPALFALEWSLSELWLARGVRPSMVLGHSVGEIVAASVAGVMLMEAGMRLVVARGRLMQELPQEDGVMIAVRCSELAVLSAIGTLDAKEAQRVSIGAVNGPKSVVVSGSASAVDVVLRSLGKDGQRLNVSHAFHSSMMRPMEEAYRSVLKTIDLSPVMIPVASTVTGRVVLPGDLDQPLSDPEHWVQQVCGPVLYAPAVKAALNRTSSNSSVLLTIRVMLEIGPNPVLIGMSKSWVQQQQQPGISMKWVTSLNQKAEIPDDKAFSQAVSVLHEVALSNRQGPQIEAPTDKSLTTPGNPAYGPDILGCFINLKAPRKFTERVSEIYMPIQRRFRVLFLHGGGGNAAVYRFILNILGWMSEFSASVLLDWFIPDGNIPVSSLTEEDIQLGGMEFLMDAGVVDLESAVYRWGGIIAPIDWGKNPALADCPEESIDTEDYIRQVSKKYGPFDLICGMSQGAVTANVLLHQQAAYNQGDTRFGVDLDLGSLKAAILFSGGLDEYHESLGLFDGSIRTEVQALLISGATENEKFLKWVEPLRSIFAKPISFIHPGQHGIPRMTEELSKVIESFLTSL